MARKRTKLGISPAGLMELKARLRTTTDLREQERLQVVLWSTQGRHTLADLAQLANRARSTIQIWLDHFEAGGLARLLERESPPGPSSPLGQPQVQPELVAGLKSGRCDLYPEKWTLNQDTRPLFSFDRINNLTKEQHAYTYIFD